MSPFSTNIDYLNPSILIDLIKKISHVSECKIAFTAGNINDLSVSVDKKKFLQSRANIKKAIEQRGIYHKINRKEEIIELYGTLDAFDIDFMLNLFRYFEYVLVLFINEEVDASDLNLNRDNMWFWNSIFNINQWKKLTSLGLFCDINHGYATIVGNEKQKIIVSLEK